MENLNHSIEKHYLKEDLFEEILKRLKDQGVNLTSVNRNDLARIDEFHVRGASVSLELANTLELSGLDVLDVGCGLGGPARMLADEYNCYVTGIDLTNEYIKTATELSKLVKLDYKTKFLVGDGSDLQFDDDSFDVVWTQHVQMNVPDKKKFYSEIKRVLRPGGHFLYYDIFKNNETKIEFPVPWASTAEQSFLFKNNEMDSILKDLGLKKLESKNQTQAGVDFFEPIVKNFEKMGTHKIGLDILMGESTSIKLRNLLNYLKNGALLLESGKYKN